MRLVVCTHSGVSSGHLCKCANAPYPPAVASDHRSTNTVHGKIYKYALWHCDRAAQCWPLAGRCHAKCAEWHRWLSASPTICIHSKMLCANFHCAHAANRQCSNCCAARFVCAVPFFAWLMQTMRWTQAPIDSMNWMLMLNRTIDRRHFHPNRSYRLNRSSRARNDGLVRQLIPFRIDHMFHSHCKNARPTERNIHMNWFYEFESRKIQPLTDCWWCVGNFSEISCQIPCPCWWNPFEFYATMLKCTAQWSIGNCWAPFAKAHSFFATVSWCVDGPS